jgi:Ca2+/Na+ antiporter
MMDILAGLILCSVLLYVFGKLSELEYPSEGYMFTVYPWLTTAPETITTTIYALKGYYVTAIANSVYSATFDTFAAFGLATLIHGDNEVKVTDLGVIAVLSACLFLLLDFDGGISRLDGYVLLGVLLSSMVYSLIRYGFPRIRPDPWTVFRIVIGLAGLGIVSFYLAYFVEALIPYLGEFLAGIVSAALTSLPDLIVATIYGVTTSYSQAQILGCIAHDFIESVAIAAVIAGLIVDANPVSTFGIVGVTVATLLLSLSYGRVTRFEALLVIIAYIVASLLII